MMTKKDQLIDMILRVKLITTARKSSDIRSLAGKKQENRVDEMTKLTLNTITAVFLDKVVIKIYKYKKGYGQYK